MILVASLLIAIASCQAQARPIDQDWAAHCFEQAKILSDADGGKLWGKRLYGPMIFVDPASMATVANQPDRDGKLKQSGKVWIGTLPDSVAPANTAIHWAGVHWTMVMWPLPELPASRGRLLMHECFHRIQDDLRLPVSNPANAHLDSKDARIWMRMEMRALARALSNSGMTRRQAIQDAIAFRKRRVQAIGEVAAAEEAALETNEGMAEYTGLKLAGYGDASLAARAAVRLEQEQASRSFSRSFAYATGPAYGLLLDAMKAPWRQIIAGRKKSLHRCLEMANEVDSRTPGQADWNRLYDYSRVRAEEEKRAEETERRIAGYRALFVEGPTLTLPVGGTFSYNYNPNAVSSFPGYGQVFETAKVTDDWGVLELSGGAMLLLRPKDLITGVVVPAHKRTEEGKVLGDGWSLTLADGWKLAPGSRDGDWVVARG